MAAFSPENLTRSAKLLVAAGLVAANPGALAAAAVGLDAVQAFLDARAGQNPEIGDLQNEVAKRLKKRLAQPDFHFPVNATVLLPQMIKTAMSGDVDFVECGLRADRIIARMIGRFTEAEHKTYEMTEAFRNLFRPELEWLLADARMQALLSPEVRARLLEQNQQLTAKVDELVARTNEAAENLGLNKGLVISLARRIAPEVEDFDTAYGELERAVATAADLNRQAGLPTNTGAAVDAVLAQMAELNEAGDLDGAAAAVDRALADLEAEEAAMQARRLALLEAGVEQDILRRDPVAAAGRLVARLELEVPEQGKRFRALRDLWIEWHGRCRDRGLKFDGEVAVELARHSVALARGTAERGAGLNDLGTALQVLGERAGDARRLQEAVAAYREALKERTREAVPLQWAMTQNNLGAALRALGVHTGDAGRLQEAVAAYREALKERTREAVPLQWAATQNNLGAALAALGARAGDAGWLQEAVAAYREALKERTRQAVPLQWAMTQGNMAGGPV